MMCQPAAPPLTSVPSVLEESEGLSEDCDELLPDEVLERAGPDSS